MRQEYVDEVFANQSDILVNDVAVSSSEKGITAHRVLTASDRSPAREATASTAETVGCTPPKRL